MFRHKKWLLLGSAVCFAVVLVSVLFGGSVDRSKPSAGEGNPVDHTPPSASDAEKQLKVAVSMPPKEFQLLQQLKEQYQKAHPGIVIQLENVPDDTVYAKLKKAAQLGEAPDVMLLDNSWVSEFAALGYLLPVDSMLAQDLQSQQMEQALAQVKWNGYVWGVPKDLDAPVLVYHTKRLADAGTEKPPATSEELVSLHKQLHKPEEGKYGIYIPASDGHLFATMVRILGGGKTASKQYPVKLNDPAVLKSLEAFLLTAPDGAKEDAKALLKSFPYESATWKPWELLAQGKIAGYLTTFSDWKQNGSPAVQTMAKIPFPKGEETWLTPWLSGRSFAISARSEAAKESFELIRDWISQPSALHFWRTAGVLPAQRNAYLTGIRDDAGFQSIAALIDNNEPTPAFPQRVKQLTALETQLDLLWKGEQPLRTFAERTEAEWETIRPASK
ncbi:extracellular solute-binding protein [Paenibacillus sp. GCM10012303]|uniref:extracellular solute-binding protein n=1 Tax=Paenibacillus sp. GCM10012303 TaxID=3317340 RepID=UPI0036198074